MNRSQLQRQAEEVEAIDKAIADELAAKNAPQVTEEEARPAEASEPETPVSNESSTPTVVEPQPSQADVELDKWRQRYQTLAGKYNAEVPRLSNEVKELKSQLGEAVERLNQAASAPKPEERKIDKLVTAADAENFGEDMLDVIKRQAAEIVAEREAQLQAEIKELRDQNSKLKGDISQVVEKQVAEAQTNLLDELTQHVPDWQMLNVDADFLEWLQQPDPMSGMPRQTHLAQAEQAGNVQVIANIFNAFKATQAPPPPPETPAPPKKSPVEEQITPGKSKSTGNTSSDSDLANKIWTNDDIEKFYGDVRAGKYRSKPDEARKIESQIDLAVLSGRIR